ncbi:MAG: hypothetical protein WBM83_07840 [Flavobacteriaceae bacterium]
MKVLILRFKNRLEKEDTIAAISCLIIALTIFFVQKVLNREIPL